MYRFQYLETIAAIRFPINHIEHFLLYRLPSRIPRSPIIASTNTLLADEKVLRIVDVLVGSRLYAIDDLSPCSISPNPHEARSTGPNAYPRLEVKQNSSWYVSRIVTLPVLSQLHEHLEDIDSGSCLVEEHIFSVPALGREVLEISVLTDAVFLTQLLPELAANYPVRRESAV